MADATDLQSLRLQKEAGLTIAFQEFSVLNLDKFVISETKDMEKYCRWIYGLHPTDEMIKKH